MVKYRTKEAFKQRKKERANHFHMASCLLLSPGFILSPLSSQNN